MRSLKVQFKMKNRHKTKKKYPVLALLFFLLLFIVATKKKSNPILQRFISLGENDFLVRSNNIFCFCCCCCDASPDFLHRMTHQNKKFAPFPKYFDKKKSEYWKIKHTLL